MEQLDKPQVPQSYEVFVMGTTHRRAKLANAPVRDLPYTPGLPQANLTTRQQARLLALRSQHEARRLAERSVTPHLCGHLPLVPTLAAPSSYCAKCAAWGCTTTNCPGHQRWPEAAAI